MSGAPPSFGPHGALTGWEERQRAREAARNTAPDEGQKALSDYLHRLTLSANDDDADEEGQGARVTLSTLHGAKGLEFRVVFLVGLEEELLPHKRTLTPSATDISSEVMDLSEERRLFYVGITRARERLYLSRCRTRKAERDARGKPRAASRFLAEVPDELVNPRDAEGPSTLGAEVDEEAFARECLARLKAMTEG